MRAVRQNSVSWAEHDWADHNPVTYTIDEALAWIAEIFEEPRQTVDEHTPREAICGWDSLGHLVLMSSLDEVFGIRLSDRELTTLKGVPDILAVLRNHKRLNE